MRLFFFLALIGLCFSFSAQETITYPYNPDSDSSGNIVVGDLQDFLITYGNDFSPSEIQIDGVGLLQVIQDLQNQLDDIFVETALAIHDLQSDNDSLTQQVQDLQNQITGLASNTSIDSLSQVISYLDSSLNALTPIVLYSGCTDELAKNFDPNAIVDDGSCDYLAIGDFYQGGIIFYLDTNGGGLIAAPKDVGVPNWVWGCSGINIPGADGTAVGTGYQNTIDMINAYENWSCDYGAANYCADLNLNGYDDWYLPSSDELYYIWLNIGGGNAYGFGNIGFFYFDYSNYWSSTEVDAENGFSGNTIDDWGSIAHPLDKTWTESVRAIRSFN